jgi:hypothetical protein
MSSPDSDSGSQSDGDVSTVNTGMIVPEDTLDRFDKKLFDLRTGPDPRFTRSTSRSEIIGLLMKKWVDGEIEL